MRRGGPLEILQLWVNLPARLKMTAPRYTGLQRDSIPSLPTADGGGRVNLIAGRWGGAEGPIRSLTGVFMATVELAAAGRVGFDELSRRNVFLYVVRGTIDIGGEQASAHTLVELGDDGERVDIQANGNSVLVFGHAAPIGEPVVAHGPFVMNTREEIVQAIRDYQAGKFDAAPGGPGGG